MGLFTDKDDDDIVRVQISPRVRKTAIASLPDDMFDDDEKERVMDAAIAASEAGVTAIRDVLFAFEKDNPDNEDCAFAAMDFCISIMGQWLDRAKNRLRDKYGDDDDCGNPDCPIHGKVSDDHPMKDLLAALEKRGGVVVKEKADIKDFLEKVRKIVSRGGGNFNKEIVIGDDTTRVTDRLEELREMLKTTKAARALGIGSIKIACIDKHTGESRMVEMDEDDIAHLEKIIANGEPSEDEFAAFFEMLSKKHSKDGVTLN